ncbi:MULTISPECIES: hypothetical protein [unclassified Pseudactinotalea]|uniref:COG1470 family protein n=1 Tax=unclassified Pseudactinotalea TaxID=2649176 RepID=UPI00128C4B79|nr:MULTISPECIES: hypothetical protein [unclassified Pseudactinotalea]MPV48653.1 hypothetical protein [Pseudactinotalea sp. HY160]QGH68624.1 hypothetical protein GCE65_03205 [Pseudactinotalea sp. HY158]
MSTMARLEETTVRLTAGTTETVPLLIRNDSDIVEGYRFEVLGVPQEWTSVEPAEITGLYPGAQTTAAITFAPPVSAQVPAGRFDFGVRVIPTENPENVVVPEGMVEVLPFLQTTAELIPRTSHGRRGARHRLAVDNRGNAPVTVQLTGGDEAGALEVEVTPPSLTVEPGHAMFTDLKVSPLDKFWRGPEVTHPFTVTVAADASTPVVLDGTHVQEPLVPTWLPKLLLALLALLILLALLWFLLLKPTIVSAAQAAVAEPVEQANERAADAMQAAQQAGEKADQAGTAAQSAQSSAVDAGDAANTANELVGSPTLDEVVSPISDRLHTTTAAGSTNQAIFEVPEKTTLKLTDFVLSNPQGDFGRLEVHLDDSVIFDVALENFRNTDYHFQAPFVASSGSRLRMVVRCDEVGVPPAQTPPPTTCDTAVLWGGQMLKPAPKPAED